MPATNVVIYRDDDGSAPLLDWMDDRRQVPTKARAKIVERIERLAQLGHELRRPEAAPLRDGVHELRVRHLRVNYRVLYCFHGRTAAVLCLGVTKEDVVDPADVDRAALFGRRFVADPAGHTYRE